MSYTEGKTKNELLEKLEGTAHFGSQVWDQMKVGIAVRCTEDIENSIKSLENQIKESSDSSKKLNKSLLWLNIVLTSATVVGAIATALMAYKAFN